MHLDLDQINLVAFYTMSIGMKGSDRVSNSPRSSLDRPPILNDSAIKMCGICYRYMEQKVILVQKNGIHIQSCLSCKLEFGSNKVELYEN